MMKNESGINGRIPMHSPFGFYEFFAGGGMARAGLGDEWACLFSNDFDHKKGVIYRFNWGDGDLVTRDVRSLKVCDLPGFANLVWASFPCQDLSLAGGGAGLKGDRSGTFWPFWNIVKGLIADGRSPELIVLENVCGMLTSHEGKDFAAICSAFQRVGYKFGAVVIDAKLFVPQSRPRLFIIGVREDIDIPPFVCATDASPIWHTKGLRSAYVSLPAKLRRDWIWWKLSSPPKRNISFADLIEENPSSVSWHKPAETRQILSMMSDINLAKVRKAKKAGRRMVGTIYKRTRIDQDGYRVQRAEIRFDDVAGCLRTPAGGSSRQLIMVVDGSRVQSRFISSREAARIMGLSDDYSIPENYNEAYHLLGDGVVVPVVRHISENILEPLLRSTANLVRAVA